MTTSIQITFACEDPGRMAEFWAGALEYIVQPPPDGYETWEAFAVEVGIPEESWNDMSAVVDPGNVGPRILFERWDGGPPNQRVHLDVNSVGHEVAGEERAKRFAEERARLEALGATFSREGTGMAGETWIEMFDPEENWFCVQ